MNKIINSEVKFPNGHYSKELKDLIINLMVKDPKKRLGSKEGLKEIRSHKWFKKINFDSIKNKKF